MKRAVLVVTDGFPVGDTVSPQTVIERANTADVSVFAGDVAVLFARYGIVGADAFADAA